MELKKFWKYLAIGMVIAVVFGITLNVGWEVIFINLFIGFAATIIKCMRKDYNFYFAAGNFGLPVFVAGVITSICIALSIA
jgi:hypothetical protein